MILFVFFSKIVRDIVDIGGNILKKVEIYTWTHCPFCIEAKKLLKDRSITYDEFRIDGDRESLNELKSETGCGTVPQIFVDDEFIGGCDDLKKLIKNNKFEEVFN